MFLQKPLLSLIFGLTLVFGRAQEYTLSQMHPENPNVSISKIAIDPSGKGYATGACGNLFRTEDFGQNWSEKNIGISSLWQMLIAPNTNGNTVLQVGNYVVNLTTDGGDTWQDIKANLPPENSGLIRDGVLLDEDTYMIITSTGFFWRTEDAGQSWVNTEDSIGNGYSYMDFVDEDNGWLMKRDGTIQKTTNGGKNWSIIFTDSDIMSNLDFVDINTGYKTNNSNVLSKTTDGGVTWTVMADNSAIFGDMFVRGPQEFWFLYNLSLKKTFDGGATFETTPIGISGQDPRYFNGFVLPDGRTWLGGNGRSILFSENGTDNWSHQLDNYPYDILSLSSANDQEEIFAISTNNELLKSEDRGDTWTLMNPGILEDLLQVHQANNGQLLLSSKDAVYLYDGTNFNERLNLGKDISILFTNKTGDQYFAYERLTQQLHYSTDGGANWIAGMTFDFQVNGFNVVDDNIFYVYGNDGHLLKSTNGGIDWEAIPTGSEIDFKSADFPTQDMWMLIAFDSIAVTMDGGQTFSLTPRVAYGQEAVVMKNELEGWLLTSNTSEGNLYKTSNAGENWGRVAEICQSIASMEYNEAKDELWLYGKSGGIYVYGMKDVDVGIDDPEKSFEFMTLIPNPSSGIVDLVLPQNKNLTGELQVFDALGKRVLLQQWNSGNDRTLDLSALDNGYYFVSLSDGDQTYQQKLILVK